MLRRQLKGIGCSEVRPWTWRCYSGVEVQLFRSSDLRTQSLSAQFAAVLADGSVVCWGDPRTGGDCSAVQRQLKDVQQVQATTSAFAAISADGSVVCWGDPRSGGDSSQVRE